MDSNYLKVVEAASGKEREAALDELLFIAARNPDYRDVKRQIIDMCGIMKKERKW